MTLHDTARRLSSPGELAEHAPALITLKRWSAAGHLQGAKHSVPGRKHPLYDYAAIKAFCRERLPVRAVRDVEAADAEPGASRAIALAQAVGVASTPDPETDRANGQSLQAQMLGALQDLARKMEGFEAHLTKLARAVDDLEHTRKTLMARYDGEMTSLRLRLDQMHSPSRDGPGLEVAAARLGQAAYRIETALQNLQPQTLGPPAASGIGTPARTPASQDADEDEDEDR